MTQRGFTLLEVLVALAIFAVIAASILSATSGALQSAQRLEDKTFASWLAENHLQQLQLHELPPPVGLSQGAAVFAGQQWLWLQEVSNTSQSKMLRVTVYVARVEQAANGQNIKERALANIVAFVGGQL